jgi:hypothetical protein
MSLAAIGHLECRHALSRLPKVHVCPGIAENIETFKHGAEIKCKQRFQLFVVASVAFWRRVTVLAE